MIIVYFLLIILVLIGIKPKLNSFNDEYISRDSTTAIKGFFVILVFCRHFNQYVTFSNNILDNLFVRVDGILGQLIVVMFLFYSGYGIFKQIENKKSGYINSFLKRRLLPVWLQFAICICLFILVNLSLGLLNNYSWSDVLLSFTGWISIGNSTWFMFVTFALYIFVFVTFKFFKFKNIIWNIIIFTALSCALGVVLYIFKTPTWWNTLLCFALGMWYGYFQNHIEIFAKNQKNYWLVFIPLLFLFLGLWFSVYTISFLGRLYIALPLLFALVLAAVTMKVKIGNPVLGFFGKHIFSIYMLQRIPMMIFQNIIPNVYLFFVVCFVTTIAIAIGFDYAFCKVRCALEKRQSA